MRALLAAAALIAAGVSWACAARGVSSQAAVPDGRAPASGGRVLRVGPGEDFDVPSKAARVARDGDVIQIVAGTYTGDVAIWRANGLTIRGVGGRAHLAANGADAEGKAIWVIKGRDTTVEDVEFSGARVRDKNGAGIRQEGPGLVVRRCVFRDNENGILTGRNNQSEIVIEHSEFANNGHGDGYSHNLYIGEVKRFVLRGSSVHHARAGHNVKSRALRSEIVYNRIMDEATGTASYAVDFPNGGVAILMGNVIQQGPRTENPTILAFGAEGLKHAVNSLYVVNNTLVNDGPAAGTFIAVRPGARPVDVLNNIFAGPGTVLSGAGTLSHNLVSREPGFIDAAQYDYHLRPGSPAIGAGMPPGTAAGTDLAPTRQYVHPAMDGPRPRHDSLDVGAFGYGPSV